MKTFNDNQGRKWELSLTIGSAKRVRDLLDVDLLQPEKGDEPLLSKIGTDEMLLCDVIYCLVKLQADALGITDEQFGELLGGDVILAAQTAFYEELIDFFQKRGRTDRSQAVAAQKKMIAVAIKHIETKISSIDVESEIEQALGKLSTSLPG